jgi:protein TonB
LAALRRGEPDDIFLIGPSIQFRLTEHLHVDSSCLFGANNVFQREGAFIVIGYDFGRKGGSESHYTPVTGQGRQADPRVVKTSALTWSMLFHGSALAILCAWPAKLADRPRGQGGAPLGLSFGLVEPDPSPADAAPELNAPVPEEFVPARPQTLEKVRETAVITSLAEQPLSFPPPMIAPSLLQPVSDRPNKARSSRGARAAAGPGSGNSIGSGSGAGSGFQPPRYVSNPAPEYPEEARRARREGIVLLAVQVGVDGRAAAIALKRSSGTPELDEAAIRAVRAWRFEPARLGNQAIAASVEVPVRFRFAG